MKIKENKKGENSDLPYSGLCHPGRSQNKNLKKQKERKALEPCQRTKKAMKHEDDGDNNCVWCAFKYFQRLGKGTGGWAETIQITALLRMARILRRVLETWGKLLFPRL